MKTIVVIAFLVVTCVACGSSSESAETAVQDRERALITDLINGDAAAVADVLADDFVHVDPGGDTWHKQDYLDAISTGTLDYLAWSVESEMGVLVGGDIAVLRYRSTIDATFAGEHAPVGEFWKSAVYEKRGERWQAVWSQSTQIR